MLDLEKVVFNLTTQPVPYQQAISTQIDCLRCSTLPNCRSRMAGSPQNLKLLVLVEEIKIAIESNDASNAATRPGLLTKITKLRDAVEAPQDSLLRIYAQVSYIVKLDWSFNSKSLMESISAVAECGTEGSC